MMLLGYGMYKSYMDPLHLVWDLDNTILCSVTPIPHDDTLAQQWWLDSFDHIDDDFPFVNNNHPNTRTYWRPGARLALHVCRLFAIQHVYTTAQGSYTTNILNQIDPNRTLFHTVIHRDMVPSSVQKGKDLQRILATVIDNYKRNDTQQQQEQEPPATTTDNDKSSSSLVSSSSSSSLLHRILLLDDRVKNFTPQQGWNGLHVVPFQLLTRTNDNNNDNNNNNNNNPTKTTLVFDGNEYLRQGREVLRMVGIAIACLIATDVRWVLAQVRSKEHQKQFPTQTYNDNHP